MTAGTSTPDAAVPAPAGADGDVVEVGICSLAPENAVRLNGVDRDYVAALACLSGDGAPPIVVHRASMRVVDGMHRLHAAIDRGDPTIRVQYFDGSEDDAFVVAVRLNTGHGLPLTRAERHAAATRIVRTHPMVSDRGISAICGVAPRTVAGIRRSQDGTAASPSSRLGRDGRVRPLRVSEAGERARQIFAERTDATVREVATLAGVSVGTAHKIRRELHGPDGLRARATPRPAPDAGRQDTGGSDPDRPDTGRRDTGRADADRPDPVPQPRTAPDPAAPSGPGAGAITALRNDPAVRSSAAGRLLLRLLGAGMHIDSEWRSLLAALPPHCRPLVATAARSCALAWTRFASRVEEST